MNIVIFNYVNLFSKSIQCVFCICSVLVSVAILGACSDIPDSPESSPKIQGVDIYATQFGENSSDPIKINSNDSAVLNVFVFPDTYKNEIQYYWYNGEVLLDSGNTYAISTSMMLSSFTIQNFIPNRLEIVDREGNRLEKSFSTIINAPPQISEYTYPAYGDTLYGNNHTPILFSWYSWDRDPEDQVFNTIEIDGISYSVGELNQVQQSGFKQGEHSFRIIVEDTNGDKDSIPPRIFFVLDTLGAP